MVAGGILMRWRSQFRNGDLLESPAQIVCDAGTHQRGKLLLHKHRIVHLTFRALSKRKKKIVGTAHSTQLLACLLLTRDAAFGVTDRVATYRTTVW